jgi:hypothetical protein
MAGSRMSTSQRPSTPTRPVQAEAYPSIRGLIIAAVGLSAVLLVAVGATLLLPNVSPAVQLAAVIILGVTVVVNLVFIMAAAFQRMSLADQRQALGLPAGSVRALIAFFLIVLFMIIGVYLFHTINSDGANVSKDALGLAQQLLTTVATLVVAVSGFYFGTASTARGAKIAQEAAETARDAKPGISTRSPLKTGKVGETYEMQFQATGGRQPYKWSLGGGQELPGLTLNMDSAVLSGTPTKAGTYEFPVQVTDAAGSSDVDQIKLVIEDSTPPPPPPPPPPSP